MQPKQPDPRYTRPVAQLLWMCTVLVAVATIAYALREPLTEIFFANRALNAVILAVFCIGVLACFWQVLRLGPALRWAERYAANREGLSAPPRLLASMSALLGPDRANRSVLSPVVAQSVTDAVYSRVSESRDFARYIAGLLVFLGLLGTFWGLSLTIPALVETIRSLTPAEGEGGLDAFARLSAGFEAQLNAMGTAFSSSLTGLAGSLVVGLLDLLGGHAQSRFLREFEEWVGSVTRIDMHGDAADHAITDQVAARHLREQIDAIAARLSALHAHAQSGRAGAASNSKEVQDSLRHAQTLAETMAREGRADPARVAQLQSQLARIRTGLGGTKSG